MSRRDGTPDTSGWSRLPQAGAQGHGAGTRAVRVMESRSPPEPGRAHGATVAVGGAPVFGAVARDALGRASGALEAACRAERRPGVFVFAVHDVLGLVGQLWLQATTAPRSGTLGRHARVDLALAREAVLSLRHLVVVVRLVEGRVRTTAVDLETLNGTHTRAGQRLSVTGEGCLHLRTGQVSLVCVPTGVAAAPPSASVDDGEDRARATPFVPSTRAPGRVGALVLHRRGAVSTSVVDEAALERGVLLGRSPRCHVVSSDPQVSRVHAVVLSIDGVACLVDAGSTNGLVHESGERARCRALVDGDRFSFGDAWLEWRELQ